MDGILIAIEGIDGAGKTTQAKLLTNALTAAGEDVVLSKEPTNGEWGQRIRESAKTGRMTLEDEIEAFVRDREEHVRTVVAPALASGRIVILDRYFYSFIAYQGARGADIQSLEEASEFAPVPNLAVLIDIDPALSLARISESRGDTPNHFEAAAQLTKVRRIFHRTFKKLPHGVTIDGSRGIRQVQSEIAECLLAGVLREKRGASDRLDSIRPPASGGTTTTPSTRCGNHDETSVDSARARLA